METKLVWLNNLNAGHALPTLQLDLCNEVIKRYSKDKIVCLEVGCAYGGAVEAMAKTLGNRGTAYGFDTFEGHPKDLSDDPNSKEAECMDYWYRDDVLGKDKLDISYQRRVLTRAGIDNAVLIKGRINANSFDSFKKVHLAMVDLDLIKPTRIAIEALKDKIVKGGYLLMHDSTSPEHLGLIYDYVHNELLQNGDWNLSKEIPEDYLTVLKRK